MSDFNPFLTAVNRTLGFEGGLNPSDSNGYASNFGINAKANPDVDVPGLTKDGARSLYKTRYWDSIGGDNLPPPLAHVAFDTAVIAGPAKAKALIAESGGDPAKLLDLRQSFQDSLAAKNPDKYGPYLASWNNRVQELRKDIGAQPQASQAPQASQGQRPMADDSIPPQAPGGLGGLGGFVQSQGFGNLLSAVGQSLLSGDRYHPFANVPVYLKDAQDRTDKRDLLDGQRQALTAALVQSGMSPQEATAYARNPDAAKIALDSLKTKKQEAAGGEFTRSLAGLLGPGTGAPAGTPPGAPGGTPPSPAGPQATPPASAFPDASAPVVSPPTTTGPVAFSNGSGNLTPNLPSPVAPPPGQSSPVAAPAATQTGAGPVVPQDKLAQSIPALIKASGNPNLPPEHRTMATAMLTKALESTAPTSDMKEYALHVQQAGTAGRTAEDFTDWQRKNKAAGKTEVTVDQRSDNEEAKAAGKAAGERTGELYKSVNAAGKGLMNLSRTEALLDNVQQGRLAPAKMSISAWAKNLGLNDEVATSIGLDPKNVGNADALQSLLKESVLSKIGSGGFPSNNFSNTDRTFLVDMLPNLANDPRANKILVETSRRAYQMDIDKGKAFNAFKKDPANKGRGFDDFEVQWNDDVAKKDRFGDLKKQAEALIGSANGPPTNGQPAPAQNAAPGVTNGGIKWSVQ